MIWGGVGRDLWKGRNIYDDYDFPEGENPNVPHVLINELGEEEEFRASSSKYLV